jgi:hypothetical protein
MSHRLLRVAWDGVFRRGSGKESFWLVRSDTGLPEGLVDSNASGEEIEKAIKTLQDIYDVIVSLIGKDRVQRDLYATKRLSRHLLLRVRLLLRRCNLETPRFYVRIKFYVRNRTIEHRSYWLNVCPLQMEAEIEAESLKYLFKRVHAFPPGKRAEILSGLRELYDRLVGRVLAGVPSFEHYELYGSGDSSYEFDEGG